MNRARLIFSFFAVALFASALFLKAQTNDAPTTTSAPADVAPTTAPATAVPATPPAPDIQASQVPAPPTTDSTLTGTPSSPAPAIGSPSISPSATQQQEEIKDIRPPFFFAHSWFLLWMAMAVIGGIALLILLWMWLKPHRLLSAKSAYELTLEKLEKARTVLREDNPVPYAVLVSEAIRSYLGQRFQAPSTRRTTEEFLRQMENDRDTPLAEHRELLRHFLQSCDLLKFAKYQPTLQELEDVHQRAYSFVTATKPAPETGRNGSHS